MRVLVVEDYVPLRVALVKGLTDAGFAVDAASNGEDGLWHAESGYHDVIVLDLMLPKMDGLTLLGRLRAIHHDTHVLILTAKDKVADRIDGLNLGADDYLTKPFVFAELLARVRALVRRRYGEKNPLLQVADLTIDTARRTVSRSSNMIDLTPREYALLEYLAHRAGEVVSRADIWEHVYDLHSDTQSNVVDVYISYLRKKLDRPQLAKLIHTRRGHGYVLGLAAR
jgi:DNA-binding response OmpR family regulator